MEVNKIHLGDCLELMKNIPDKSVDMILCDLPYGTTACKWDTIIPLDKLWEQYCRIIKDNAAIVLTASQPFTSKLISSNYEMFKYEWIWEKSKASNFLQAKINPLKAHENVLVFSKKSPKYYPQKTQGEPYNKGSVKQKNVQAEVYNEIKNYHSHVIKSEDGTRFPRTIQYFKTAEFEGKLHPTQKPVALFEYLIKTYTNEGDLVLDNCIGSGTTAIAAINTNRNFIGIEKEEKYFDIATERIALQKKEIEKEEFNLFEKKYAEAI